MSNETPRETRAKPIYVTDAYRGASANGDGSPGHALNLRTTKRPVSRDAANPLPALRFEIQEASRVLRMSRAQLYHRISEGAIRVQKDGSRTYITLGELQRYVDSCDHRDATRN